MSGHLHDTSNLLGLAVNDTIAALDLADEDAAAVKLAQRYAAAIDATLGDARAHASAMRWIAPQLLDVLEALGATPAARNRLKKGGDKDARPSRIQGLRDARGA
jgi:hypothetical protein